MAFLHLKTLFPKLLVRAPNCPEILAAQCLKLAAIELCEKTECWKEVLGGTLSDVNYPVTTLSGTAVHLIKAVSANNIPLRPVIFGDIETSEMNNSNQIGQPRLYTQKVPGTIQIYPLQVGAAIAVFAVLKPLAEAAYNTSPYPLTSYVSEPFDDANAIFPEELMPHCSDAIVTGALAKALETPGFAFSNFDGAAFYAAKFRQQCADLISFNTRGQQRAPLRTKGSYM